MTNSEVVSRLKQLVRARGTFKTIEVSLKMPKNCLSNYASQKKPLPEKWVKPLAGYFENLNKKRFVLIEDKSNPERSGSYWLTEDGRKCTLVWEDQEEKKDPKSDAEIKNDAAERNRKDNEKVDLSEKKIPPMPVKEKGEDSFDFAARKNEWKKKYNQ